MRLLSDPTEEGPGWATDTRLRPRGSRGLLVVSLEAFDRYHASQAAAWERQALVRARVVGGDAELAKLAEERFTAIAYGSAVAPAEDLARMRRRIEEELSGEKPGRFHPKLGYGGLVDVEFATQWLQMKHGASHPNVRRRGTLEAIDALEREQLLDPRDADALRGSFELFRSVEQALKLLDETREPILAVGGPIADRVARRLRLRERDGMPPAEVLVRSWIRRATAARSVFERLVAPVGLTPPWERAK
jgi:glutamate-ammonia-ligase adenylyltransferase